MRACSEQSTRTRVWVVSRESPIQGLQVWPIQTHFSRVTCARARWVPTVVRPGREPARPLKIHVKCDNIGAEMVTRILQSRAAFQLIFSATKHRSESRLPPVASCVPWLPHQPIHSELPCSAWRVARERPKTVQNAGFGAFFRIGPNFP